mmetsp:Transcript_7199/g.14705  ORF Transcript_7199/g.14705 Transcript_7199/m.14705 type:complete len:221 (+) Transcript_7199:623-1285(+)
MQNTVASSTESPPTPSPSATTSSPSISSGAGASDAGSLGLLRRRRPPWQLVAAAPLPRQRQSVSPATRYAQLRLRHCDGVTCPATGIHAYRVQRTGDGSRTSSRTGRPRRFPRMPSASARLPFGWREGAPPRRCATRRPSVGREGRLPLVLEPGEFSLAMSFGSLRAVRAMGRFCDGTVDRVECRRNEWTKSRWLTGTGLLKSSTIRMGLLCRRHSHVRS